MATDERKLFLGALREVLGPQLRADGFRGSGANYRRFRDPVIQIINVQGSRDGGECCVNLGVHLAFLPTVAGQPPDPRKLTESECEFRRRLTPEGLQDQWWSYGWDEPSSKESATRLAALFREYGKPHLDAWSAFPGLYAAVTVDDLEVRRLGALPGWQTSARAALAFARVHAHLNRRERAREFAEWGLKHLGRATALQPELERLLSADASAG
jgi:hypothetical protein